MIVPAVSRVSRLCEVEGGGERVCVLCRVSELSEKGFFAKDLGCEAFVRVSEKDLERAKNLDLVRVFGEARREERGRIVLDCGVLQDMGLLDPELYFSVLKVVGFV